MDCLHFKINRYNDYSDTVISSNNDSLTFKSRKDESCILDIGICKYERILCIYDSKKYKYMIYEIDDNEKFKFVENINALYKESPESRVSYRIDLIYERGYDRIDLDYGKNIF